MTEHCREVSASLRTALRALGVHLPRTSTLAKLLAEVDWLTSFTGPPLDERSGASAKDPDRAAQAVLRFPQFEDIARALHVLGPSASENPEGLRALRRDFDRLHTQSADAQNRLFELEVAGRLAMRGILLRFEDPDIVATSAPFGRFCLECKRSQNLARVRQRLAKGARQIERRRLDGFVVVDLQPLIFSSHERERPTRFYVLRSAAELRGELAADMDRIIEKASDAVARARAVDHVKGVVFAATGWGIGETTRPSTYEWAWVTRPGIPATEPERDLCRLLGGVSEKPDAP